MTVAIIIAVGLVLGTSLFHLSVLRWLSGGASKIPLSGSMRVLLIVLTALAAHIVEIVLYAAAYALSVHTLQLGKFSGVPVDGALDYLYFSIVSYTSLGLGDVFPDGHLRFIAGIEALNGLLLIAWSGAFIYIAMEKVWPWESCSET
tara:strand:- start:11 stop:451 length:441 start_codon:yes stop_codon:yes gene_type:complete